MITCGTQVMKICLNKHLCGFHPTEEGSGDQERVVIRAFGNYRRNKLVYQVEQTNS